MLFDFVTLGRGDLVVHVGRYQLTQSRVLSICQEPDQFFFPLMWLYQFGDLSSHVMCSSIRRGANAPSLLVLTKSIR